MGLLGLTHNAGHFYIQLTFECTQSFVFPCVAKNINEMHRG